MPDDSPAADPATRRADILLETVAAEIEAYVGQAGWDLAPALFALVPTRVLAADPAAASLLGPDAGSDQISADALTPVAQEELPDGPLDEVLAQIGWPAEVLGCALSQEIVLLPPSAEPDLTDLASEAAAGCGPRPSGPPGGPAGGRRAARRPVGEHPAAARHGRDRR